MGLSVVRIRICCGAGGWQCPTGADGTVRAPDDCSPECAVAFHSFTTTCGAALNVIVGEEGGSFSEQVASFEQRCVENADPLFFLDAIMNARCDDDAEEGLTGR